MWLQSYPWFPDPISIVEELAVAHGETPADAALAIAGGADAFTLYKRLQDRNSRPHGAPLAVGAGPMELRAR